VCVFLLALSLCFSLSNSRTLYLRFTSLSLFGFSATLSELELLQVDAWPQ
jgi:hypothetical protein